MHPDVDGGDVDAGAATGRGRPRWPTDCGGVVRSAGARRWEALFDQPAHRDGEVSARSISRRTDGAALVPPMRDAPDG
jgi:hypothetical protein